jgi:ribosomal protein L11 methyltransferase
LATATRVLDVGCGSGVLAIAAAKAFAQATGLGIDIDIDAVEVSRENAHRNFVDARLSFSDTALTEVRGSFDVVFANILPEVLVPLAPALAARVAAGGTLILSGILVEQAAAVELAYAHAGCTLLAHRDEEGWRALLFTSGKN